MTAQLRLAALIAAGLVVSRHPTVTELVFALGAGNRLVGRTNACDYPSAVGAVPNVGGWLPPNVEAVAARSPDLVVLYQSPTTAPAAAPSPRAPAAIAALGRRLDPVLHAYPLQEISP